MVTDIANLKSAVSDLTSNMDNYVTVKTFNETVTGINNDIIELAERLAWTDLTE